MGDESRDISSRCVTVVALETLECANRLCQLLRWQGLPVHFE